MGLLFVADSEEYMQCTTFLVSTSETKNDQRSSNKDNDRDNQLSSLWNDGIVQARMT